MRECFEFEVAPGPLSAFSNRGEGRRTRRMPAYATFESALMQLKLHVRGAALLEAGGYGCR